MPVVVKYCCAEYTFVLRYVLLKKMLLPWTRSTQSIPELTTTQECDALFGHELTIVFKHSPTCPISLFAHREVMRFRKAQPDALVFLVSVRRACDVARHIAERTGVRHESPQIVVLRRGVVVAAASHDEITAELLSSVFGSECAESFIQQ